MTLQNYVFDNSWQQGLARLQTVESLLDPGSIRLLATLGLQSGWRCLEVGAGGGSVARWMADQVAPGGQVVATDIDTRYVEALGDTRIQTLQHNIVREDLEEGAYNLIHTRLVLEHLPERYAVLAKMARALKPGGWLMVEDVDYVSGVPVSDLGAAEHEHSLSVRLREFSRAGVEHNLGRRLPQLLREAALTNVGNEGRVWVMEGGSAGARWFKLSMVQLRGRLVGPGKLTDAEVDRMLELFDDPNWAAYSPIIMAAWGQAA